MPKALPGGITLADLLILPDEIDQLAPIGGIPIDLPHTNGRSSSVRRKQDRRQFILAIDEEDIDEVVKLKGGSGGVFRLFFAIHSQKTLTKSLTVTLPKDRLLTLGLDRKAVSKGLPILEAAGFVRVAREPGKSARITLLARDRAKSSANSSTSTGSCLVYPPPTCDMSLRRAAARSRSHPLS